MRFKNSIRNMLSELIPQVVLLIIGLLKVKFFVQILGDDINGFNLTISSIVAYLTMVEGGFGTSLMQKLYEPLAKNDTEKVKELYLGSERILHIIGLVILILGVIVSFFMPHLTEGVFSSGYAILLFLIIIVPTAMSYFIMAPVMVVIADQKHYKVNIILKSLQIIRGLVQIAFLFLGFDYIWLVVMDGLTVFMQYYLSRLMAFKEYPYLKNCKGVKRDMSAWENTKHVFVHKISSTVKSRSATIIILFTYPGTIGLSLTSIFGSYNYIINTFNEVMSGVLNAPKESFAHLLVTEKQRVYATYKQFLVLTYFIATILCVTTFITINDFVLLWLNQPSYIQTSAVAILFTYMLFEAMVRIPIHAMRDISGLFKESKAYAVLEASVTVILGIILTKTFKITGVLMAMLIGSIISGFILNPRLVYKRVFKKNLLWFYYDIIKQILIMVVVSIMAFNIWTVFLEANCVSLVLWFLNAGLLFLIIIILSFMLYFVFLKEFRLFIKNLWIKLKKHL